MLFMNATGQNHTFVSILRIVAKAGFTYDLASLLVQHIEEAVNQLENEVKVATAVSSTKIC